MFTELNIYITLFSMKPTSTKLFIRFTLLSVLLIGITSCMFVDDALSCSNSASWSNDSCSKFTVSFSSDTRESKNVTIDIHTKKDSRSCSVRSTTSLKNTKIYELSRGLKDGEYVEITWWDVWHNETLYGKD